MRQLIDMTHKAPRTTISAPEPAPVPAGLRLRVDKLCVAIQADSPAELMERAEAALADSKFLEFRLDSLPKPAAALPKVKEFLADHREATVIATCRRKQFGGHFAGSLKAELEVLAEAAEAGCQIVDLEVESAEEAAPRQWDELRARLRAAGTALLVSFSRLSRTEPGGLEQAARAHRGLPAGFRQGGHHGPLAGRQPGRPQADREPLALLARRGHRHGRGGTGEPRAGTARRRGLYLRLLRRRRARRRRAR